ncbi:MAG: hypothetical protein LBU22_01100 [Dysgonamonadaceae bacterium]|jgi:hypothetical protein|nr:hypothetical protein [Dysgonamonadaceae bacterium]
METISGINNEAKAILEYIANDLSWRKLFFSKFSTWQKFSFFLPAPFICLPIYGTYSLLFKESSYFLFIIFAIIGIISIWTFAKQKTIIEKKVFEKYYLSESCKNILEFYLEKFSSFLGEQNTAENRALWIKYFKKKSNSLESWIIPLAFGFSPIGFGLSEQFIEPLKNYELYFMWAYISFMFLLVAFAFILPSIIDIKFKYGEAFKLISELEKRMTKELLLQAP